MKKVVKAKNLIAFRIWLEKLGYSVKTLADNRGFTFSFKKEYGLVTCDLAGNNLARILLINKQLVDLNFLDRTKLFKFLYFNDRQITDN